jgi:proline dehydrogenase
MAGMPLLSDLTVGALSMMPTAIMRHFSSKYIAGESLAEAIERLALLNAEGYSCILDILGEDADGEAGARSALEQYMDAASRLTDSDLDAYVSVKPTHFGLRTGEDLCFDLYSTLAAHCDELGQFLRVEMEDHGTTDATLRVFARLLEAHANVGIVMQSRLFRNAADIEALLTNLPQGRQLNVRLVKGIYLEPMEIAHTQYQPIADSYVAHARLLFEGGATVSLATHDEKMGAELIALVKELDIPKQRYEFQVLMGVRRPLWALWKNAGHPVRVYVPYGPEWKAYSLRRLKKNPKLLTQVAFGAFRK